MIWRLVLSPDMRETYASVATWPLPRIVAANDLLDELEYARAMARAES